MAENEIYLYCALRGSDCRTIPWSSLSLSRSLFIIDHDPLAAVASLASPEHYEHTPQNLLVHFEVLSKLMQYTTAMIPISFATVAHSEGEVKSLLSKLVPISELIFERLRGRVEYDLEARWNPLVAYQQIAKEDPQISELKERAARSGLAVSMEDRLAVGKLVAEAVAKKAKEYSGLVDQRLCQIAIESCPLPMTRRDHELFHRSGFFVEIEKTDAFEKKIYETAEFFKDSVHFKYAGPLPPYSFTGLDILVIHQAMFDEARKELGLGSRFDQPQLKEAYRKLSLQWHPDRTANTGSDPAEATERFKMISAAYELLERFFEQCGPIFSRDHLPETTLLLGQRSKGEGRRGFESWPNRVSSSME